MANEIEKVDPATGEIMTMVESNQPLAVQLQQAELNQAVTTAKAFPRRVPDVVRKIMELATIDEESAKESVYALPRGGKPIKGPSIRFAEIVASMWGNCHTGSRVVAVDKFDKVVIAEGVFLDLETGMKRTAQIRRRIVDKYGKLYNDDMIVVTGNAAASIAMREAILKGIPKAVWRQAYDHCERVLAGDVKTLNERRDKAIGLFAAWGVKPEQVFAALDVQSIDDIGLDQIATLQAMREAIKSGAQTVEDYFPAHSNADKATEAAKGTAAKLGKIADQRKATQTKEIAGNGKTEGKESSDQSKTTAGAGEEGGNGASESEGGGDEEGDSTVDNGGGGEGQTDGSAGDGGGADDTDVTEREFSDEEIAGAYERGVAAKKKGMARKAMPQEWRAEGFEALADAWARGWQDG